MSDLTWRLRRSLYPDTSKHVFEWLIESESIDLTTLVNEARKTAMAELDQAAGEGKADREESMDGQTATCLSTLLYNLVNEHLGDFGKDGSYSGGLFPGNTFNEEDEILIGGLFKLAVESVRFRDVANAIMLRVEELVLNETT